MTSSTHTVHIVCRRDGCSTLSGCLTPPIRHSYCALSRWIHSIVATHRSFAGPVRPILPEGSAQRARQGPCGPYDICGGHKDDIEQMHPRVDSMASVNEFLVRRLSRRRTIMGTHCGQRRVRTHMYTCDGQAHALSCQRALNEAGCTRCKGAITCEPGRVCVRALIDGRSGRRAVGGQSRAHSHQGAWRAPSTSGHGGRSPGLYRPCMRRQPRCRRADG